MINNPLAGPGPEHEALFPAPVQKTVVGRQLAGLVTALCCGGLPLFASIGLGAAYSSLGLWRYVPVFLALGTLSIVAINWLYYRRKAAASPAQLRRAMFVSAAIGLVFMVGALFFLDWVEHAVGTAERFAEGAHPEAPGAMNQGRLYALGVLPAGLALLGVLPFKISQRR